MSKSKAKGYRAEVEVVKLLTEGGVPSERVPLSGSMGGKYSSDVVIGSIDTPLARIEVKNRENIADYIWDFLEPVDYLVLRKNNRKPLVVMDIDEFIRLFKATQNNS